MKREDVDAFEKLTAQLTSLHQELSVLARKSPNDAVNTFKINFVTATLAQANKLFGAKYRPFTGFTLFDADNVPSNSDVTFIISQYIECAEKYRADHITRTAGQWHWDIAGGQDLRTSPPKKLTNK